MEAGDGDFLEDAADDNCLAGGRLIFCEREEEAFEEGCWLEQGFLQGHVEVVVELFVGGDVLTDSLQEH